MAEREVQIVCPECNQPFSVSAADAEGPPSRCDACFQMYLREIDADFLANYAEFGVLRHRVVAETCFRALALDSPGHRKVLAMEIFNQYVLALADLIGLYTAIQERTQRPILESFLNFELNPATSRAFFAEVTERSPSQLLAALGLPFPDQLRDLYPEMRPKEAKDLSGAIQAVAWNLEKMREREAGTALALGQVAAELKSGSPLTQCSDWLRDQRLAPDQVAALVLDYRRRTVSVNPLSVDEHRLSEIVDAIDIMTRTAIDLVYAFLTVQEYDERRRLLHEGAQTGPASARLRE